MTATLKSVTLLPSSLTVRVTLPQSRYIMEMVFQSCIPCHDEVSTIQRTDEPTLIGPLVFSCCITQLYARRVGYSLGISRWWRVFGPVLLTICQVYLSLRHIFWWYTFIHLLAWIHTYCKSWCWLQHFFCLKEPVCYEWKELTESVCICCTWPPEGSTILPAWPIWLLQAYIDKEKDH